MRLLALALVLLAPAAPAQKSEWTPERAKRLNAALEAIAQSQSAVGVSAAISHGGVVKWIAAAGHADLENNVPAKPNTAYRTGSIAKPFTAVAALQLWERGKFDLDAPVQKYVPSYPEKQWPVSVRMLLGHLGGVRHYRAGEINSTTHFNNLSDPLKIFSADPLLHQPRSKYLYTTYGYNLAGAAVESAAGVPFLDYLRENIFKPAKLEATREDNSREIVPNRTRFYSKTEDGRIINAPLADTSNKIPGGGLLTTVEDLLRFAAAWEQGLLLKKSTMQMQTQRQQLLDGKHTGYGLGWNVTKVAGRNAVSHNGAQQGCKTSLVMFPDEKLAVAVLINSDHVDPVKFVSALLDALEPPPATAGAKPAKPQPQR
jgi:serine beta-lactamase-like protein LACTB, mitochondrial